MKMDLQERSGDGEDLSLHASSMVEEWAQLGLSPSAARLGQIQGVRPRLDRSSMEIKIPKPW